VASCRSPARQVCNFELDDVVSKGGVHVTTKCMASALSRISFTSATIDLDQQPSAHVAFG
jgi:hypothetical protein